MKKCIVLDLDNTLWGGVVGEDGIDGIQLSLTAPGASFIAFQQALLDLHDRGVILAINSQNNEDDALEVIRTHPNMILKEKHFSAMRINWADKAENIHSIAKELNIGLDSMVFLDDNPTNRAAMREFVPEVETPELPLNASEYTKLLLSLPYFDSRHITDEDKMRGNLYVTERLRREHEKGFANREAFLTSLGLELRVFENDVSALPRLSQLTEKTNQFNVHKIPLSTDELNAYMESKEHIVFHGTVTDKFGQYGVTAFALVRKDTKEWHIESYLLSCRVIGRGVEEAFLAAIARRAMEAGSSTLSIAFEPTEKNKPAQKFVETVFAGKKTPAEAVQSPGWVHTI